MDDRLKDLADDIAAEREARMTAVKAEQIKREQHETAEREKNDCNGVWIRWGVSLAIGIPAAYFAWSAFFAGGTG